MESNVGKMGGTGAHELTLLIQIEYWVTKKEKGLVTDFLMQVLAARTQGLLLQAEVFTWDLVRVPEPPTQLHILTDVMGLDREVLTVVLKNRKAREV